MERNFYAKEYYGKSDIEIALHRFSSRKERDAWVRSQPDKDRKITVTGFSIPCRVFNIYAKEANKVEAFNAFYQH